MLIIQMVFYVCGHTGVLLDCEENSQRLLQGHSNRITCTAVSGDKRWLVTADCGCGAMLTVWDSYTVYVYMSTPLIIVIDSSNGCSVPVRSIFEGLGEGCQVVAMSTDAKYIAAISTGSPQVGRRGLRSLYYRQTYTHLNCAFFHHIRC